MIEYIQENIEELYFESFPQYLAETDAAWDAMHRLLSDSTLTFDTGPEPNRFTIMGGRPLHSGDDYIISYKTPDQVRAVSESISKISFESFKVLYESIDETEYEMEKSGDDLAYTWDWFNGVVELYRIASNEGRGVIFTVDQ
jgi:hypothetical protein